MRGWGTWEGCNRCHARPGAGACDHMVLDDRALFIFEAIDVCFSCGWITRVGD